MGIEEVKEVMRRERERSLRISRIPKRIRDNFMRLADDEFEGDYGMTLKYLWDKYETSVLLFNNFDIKLDYIIELSKSTSEQKEDTTKSDYSGHTVQTLSGKIVKGG